MLYKTIHVTHVWDVAPKSHPQGMNIRDASFMLRSVKRCFQTEQVAHSLDIQHIILHSNRQRMVVL